MRRRRTCHGRLARGCSIAGGSGAPGSGAIQRRMAPAGRTTAERRLRARGLGDRARAAQRPRHVITGNPRLSADFRAAVRTLPWWAVHHSRMEVPMRTATFVLMLFVAALPAAAQSVVTPPPAPSVANLSGPRFGVTQLSDGVVASLTEKYIEVGPTIS